jgi:hypothetical protein
MVSHFKTHMPFIWVVLISFVIVTTACGLPLSAVSTTQTATTSTLPTVVFPTSAQPDAVVTASPTLTTAPSATFPQPVPTATFTQPAPTATRTQPPPAAPTRTNTPMQLSEVTIFFIAVGDNGLTGPKIGCDDSLVAVKQPIEPTSGVIRAALNRLFSFKEQEIGESGLYTALWQSNLAIESARVDSGVATVYLTGQVQLGGVCDTPRFKAQIEETILVQPGVIGARVFINGVPIDQALSSQ